MIELYNSKSIIDWNINAAGTIPEQEREAPGDANGAVGAAGEPPLLAIGSAVVLVLGLALFGLLRVADRERRDGAGT